MATVNEQLQKIAIELQQQFSDNPYITISAFDDDPPEKYEITYHLKGVGLQKNGKITELNEHAIFIKIPFGFPYFPPSCTPQSATFHPAFDQAAICIGEYWNKDRKLSELIIHIGRMIVGEIYPTENTFNEAAARWYQKNSKNLPFQKVTFPEIQPLVDDAVMQQTEPLFMQEDEEFTAQGIDTIQDSDIDREPDYFGTALNPFSEETIQSNSGKSSVNRVFLLFQQRRFYELEQFLTELLPDEKIPDQDKITTQTNKKIHEATELNKQAEQCEHEGQPEEALALYKQTKELVSDFPDIDENIARAKRSFELAEQWNDTTLIDEEKQKTDPGQSAQTKKITFFEESSKVGIKILPLLTVVLVIILAITIIVPYFKAGNNLKEAEATYSICQQYLNQGSFTSAKQSCDDAMNKLKDIAFFKQTESKVLQRQIQQTLSSRPMVQGLAGNVLFEGKYIPKAQLEKVMTFTKSKEDADRLFTMGRWKNALSKYENALLEALPIMNSIDKMEINTIKERIAVANIKLLIERGDSFLNRGELEKGKETFSQSLENAEKLPEETGGEIILEIQQRLDEITYLEHLNLGKKYFYENDWESAIKQYEQALKLQQNDPRNLAGNNQSLYANMAEAELGALISSAKQAFSRSEMSKAIDLYEKAIALLATKKDLLSRIHPDEISQQLQRIILRARIVQLKQKADTYLKEEKYKEANDTLSQVADIIVRKGFQEDLEFRAIIKGTNETIEQSKEKALILERIAYLQQNYKSIFKTNYSAANPANLSDPKATFLRNVKGKELYELQCLENNMGRKLRLVMLYSFDPATEKWTFYSENE